MARTSTKSRSKGSAQKRPAPRPSRGEGFPVLPVAVGAVLLAVVLALVGYVVYSSAAGSKHPSAQTVSQAYGCASPEMLTQTHFHTHVQIWVGGGPDTGQPGTIPAQVGITSAGFCWLHTHDASGIIHVEAPTTRANQGFYLSDFLKVWQLSDSSASLSPGAGERAVVFVDGKQVKTAPANVKLKSLEDITIEFLKPDQSPVAPAPYKWPTGFGA